MEWKKKKLVQSKIQHTQTQKFANRKNNRTKYK